MAYKVKGTNIISDAGSIDSAQSKIIMNNSLMFEAIIYSPVQGSTSGYTSGGNYYTSPTPHNTIDKFSFASDGNATDVGDLSQARTGVTGQSSAVSGYTSGGFTYAPPQPSFNTIDKFPFATNTNATDVGDLTVARWVSAGQSSDASGYTSGGTLNPASPFYSNIVDKFPFAANANATDVGDLTEGRIAPSGQSSSTSGYSSGGQPPPGAGSNIVDKFPFASNANAADVGDLTVARHRTAGQSSDASGYTSGGQPNTNVIDKFPFASDGNATDVGDLTEARSLAAGQSSTTSGYTSGGGYSNVIDKFPFASNANATDVGNLTQAKSQPAGQQV